MKNCLLLSRHQQEPHWPSKSYKAVSINLQKKDSLHINLSKLKVYSQFTETFIIYLWKSFPVSILKFNTFLSISTSTRYQSFGYLPHWNMVRWQAVTCCWGVLGDTRHLTSYNRREIWLLYMYCKPSFIHVGKKFQVHRNLITVNMFWRKLTVHCMSFILALDYLLTCRLGHKKEF